jgi:hypothetical protein
MRSILTLISLGFFSIGNAQAKLSKSDMVKVDFRILAEKKKRLQEKNPEAIAAYRQLLSDAAIGMKYRPVSVMDKTDFPPSGNKHDYMSIGPYWWPDPSKPDGLPYIRRDGEINPEVANFPDKENMPKMCEHVYNLGLAYYFSGDTGYAEHAARLMRTWFIDTATRMNPHLNYGQAVKGKTEGRAEGLIDSRYFIFFIDAIGMLKDSKCWSASDDKAMKAWMSDFLKWMHTSKIGVAEMKSGNNHGVWFDAQALAIALYTGDNVMADKIVRRAADRLDEQLDEEGFFPKEMQRTTSLHYTVFIMNAFTIIADLSEQTGLNLWTWESANGKSYRKAFDVLLPYLAQEKAWPAKQIKEFHYTDAYPILLRGSTKLKCKSCWDIIRKTAGRNYDSLLLHLL